MFVDFSLTDWLVGCLVVDPQSGWKKNQLIFGLAELSRKLENAAKIRLIANNFGRAVEPKLNDVLVVVVCFFDVTKPASICNHKKFRNHGILTCSGHSVNVIIR